MSKKVVTYISLVFIFCVGLWFFQQSRQMMEMSNQDNLGPGFFPFWLTILLFILCILSFIKTKIEKTNETFKIPNFGVTSTTVVIIVLFLISWGTLGYFYVQGFIFLWILLALYRLSSGLTFRFITINTSISLIVTGFVYVIFDVVMNIQL